MNAKHTPGPWEVDDENQIIAHGRVLVTVSRDDDLDQWDADVSLIAAAPDLLETLSRIRQFSSAIERGEEPWREGVQEITRMAMAALKKARQ